MQQAIDSIAEPASGPRKSRFCGKLATLVSGPSKGEVRPSPGAREALQRRWTALDGSRVYIRGKSRSKRSGEPLLVQMGIHCSRIPELVGRMGYD